MLDARSLGATVVLLYICLNSAEGLHVGKNNARSFPQGPHNPDSVRRDASFEPTVDYTAYQGEDSQSRKLLRRMVPLRGPVTDSKNNPTKIPRSERLRHSVLDVQQGTHYYGPSPRSRRDFGGLAMPVGGGAAGVLSAPAHSLKIATTAAAAAVAVAVGIRPMATGAIFMLKAFACKYSLFSKAFPWSCAVLTASVKGCVADALAQITFPDKTVSGQRPRFNIKRNLAFMAFGFFYLGIFAQAKYGVIYPAWFGHAQDAMTITKKVLTDMMSGPIIYFPLYFLLKFFFVSDMTPKEAIQDYRVRMPSLLRNYWAVWIPVEVVMWLGVPPHLRIAYLSSFSLFWQITLSVLSYKRLPARS